MTLRSCDVRAGQIDRQYTPLVNTAMKNLPSNRGSRDSRALEQICRGKSIDAVIKLHEVYPNISHFRTSHPRCATFDVTPEFSLGLCFFLAERNLPTSSIDSKTQRDVCAVREKLA